MTATWFRFKVADPASVDPLRLTKPLLPLDSTHISQCHVGSVENTNDVLVVIAWKSPETWSAFQADPKYEDILQLWREASTDNKVDIRVFPRGPPIYETTCVKYTYFPATFTPEQRDKLMENRLLRIGWVQGTETWNGQDVVVAVVCAQVSHPGGNVVRRPKISKWVSPFTVHQQKCEALGALGVSQETVAFKSWVEWFDGYVDSEDEDEDENEDEDDLDSEAKDVKE